MTLLNVSLILPTTVNFYPTDELSSNESPSSEPKPESPPAEDYTTFSPHKTQQLHGRSQSLTLSLNTSLTSILLKRPPPAIAKTPGATTDLESIFKPENAAGLKALQVAALTRNKSASSLQALIASECQHKAWGKTEDSGQPKSLAMSPPSQSIFDDAATSRGSNTNAPDVTRSDPRMKIARRKKKEIDYTTHNWIAQPTTLGNTGLFAAMNAVTERDGQQDHYWVGTIGMPTDGLPPDVKQNIAEKFESDMDLLVVYMNDTDMNGHYENYCKNILWPIFHSQVPDVPKSKVYQDNSWSYYRKVNEAFAEHLVRNYKDGDAIWVHDYHLLLVPALVREKHPRAQIGLFLHCAFPPSEIFRNLPSRLELITGMLGANMIGFQTDDYRYQFLQTCSRLLNIEATDHGLVLENGRFIDVHAIPMGIDFNSMNLRRQNAEVGDYVRQFSERFAGKRVILSRDKFDAVHGIKHKLRGFAEFLHRYPQWDDQVVLVQIATSATQDIELRDTVNNLIMEINGDWGNINHQPIVYLNQEIEYTQYLALMSVADCMLNTSLSEGMNLTCHEFVLCQYAFASLKGYAPMVISEAIGAARVFRDNAILINPWHPKGIAEALDRALSMEREERKQRWQIMFELTRKYCAKNWYDAFTSKLENAWKEHNARDPAAVPRLQMRDLRPKYAASKKRLIVVDFEGTLTTWDSPKEVVITIPLRVIQCMNDMYEDPRNIVYVMSQHSTDALDHMFRNVPAPAAGKHSPRLGLIAENGGFIRKAGDSKWTEAASIDTSEWRKGVMDILKHFTNSIPGSTVREIKSGMMFNYADATDQPDAMTKAGELANQINEMCENLDVSATPVDKGLYISPNKIDKALAASIIEQDLFADKDTQPDFVLVIGDSYEDECMFEWAHNLRGRVKSENVVTCIVGKRSTAASCAITQGTVGVVATLEKLASLRDPKSA